MGPRAWPSHRAPAMSQAQPRKRQVKIAEALLAVPGAFSKYGASTEPRGDPEKMGDTVDYDSAGAASEPGSEGQPGGSLASPTCRVSPASTRHRLRQGPSAPELCHPPNMARHQVAGGEGRRGEWETQRCGTEPSCHAACPHPPQGHEHSPMSTSHLPLAWVTS